MTHQSASGEAPSLPLFYKSPEALSSQRHADWRLSADAEHWPTHSDTR